MVQGICLHRWVLATRPSFSGQGVLPAELATAAARSFGAGTGHYYFGFGCVCVGGGRKCQVKIEAPERRKTCRRAQKLQASFQSGLLRVPLSDPLEASVTSVRGNLLSSWFWGHYHARRLWWTASCKLRGIGCREDPSNPNSTQSKPQMMACDGESANGAHGLFGLVHQPTHQLTPLAAPD